MTEEEIQVIGDKIVGVLKTIYDPKGVSMASNATVPTTNSLLILIFFTVIL